MLRRYSETPEAGVQTLMLEHVALALNPTQGLIAGKRAIDVVREAGLEQVLERFERELDATPHTIYEIRRLIRPQKLDPTKMANAARSVRRLTSGSRSKMIERLSNLGHDVVVGEDGITRLYTQTRGETLPAREHFFVVAPAFVHDKQDKNFESWWEAVA